MTMSTFRIVLVDTLGEELFSGSSVLSTLPPPVEEVVRVEGSGAGAIEEDEEPIPPTLRSSVFVRLHESGEYPSYRRSDSATYVTEVVPSTERVVAEQSAEQQAGKEEEDNRAA
jgi:hypothetical protein